MGPFVPLVSSFLTPADVVAGRVHATASGKEIIDVPFQGIFEEHGDHSAPGEPVKKRGKEELSSKPIATEVAGTETEKEENRSSLPAGENRKSGRSARQGLFHAGDAPASVSGRQGAKEVEGEKRAVHFGKLSDPHVARPEGGLTLRGEGNDLVVLLEGGKELRVPLLTREDGLPMQEENISNSRSPALRFQRSDAALAEKVPTPARQDAVGSSSPSTEALGGEPLFAGAEAGGGSGLVEGERHARRDDSIVPNKVAGEESSRAEPEVKGYPKGSGNIESRLETHPTALASGPPLSRGELREEETHPTALASGPPLSRGDPSVRNSPLERGGPCASMVGCVAFADATAKRAPETLVGRDLVNLDSPTVPFRSELVAEKIQDDLPRPRGLEAQPDSDSGVRSIIHGSDTGNVRAGSMGEPDRSLPTSQSTVNAPGLNLHPPSRQGPLEPVAPAPHGSSVSPVPLGATPGVDAGAAAAIAAPIAREGEDSRPDPVAGAHRVLSHVLQGIEQMRREGRERLEIPLQLEKHEGIKIRLSLQEGQLQTTILTDSDVLRSGLRRSWGTFSRQLHYRGIEAEKPRFGPESQPQPGLQNRPSVGEATDGAGRELSFRQIRNVGTGAALHGSTMTAATANQVDGSENASREWETDRGAATGREINLPAGSSGARGFARADDGGRNGRRTDSVFPIHSVDTTTARNERIASEGGARSPESQQVFRNVFDGLERMRHSGLNRMDLELKLEGKETLKVRLVMTGNQLQAVFITDSEALRGALRQSWETFSRQLHDRGIEAGMPEFESGPGGDESGGGRPGDGIRSETPGLETPVDPIDRPVEPVVPQRGARALEVYV